MKGGISKLFFGVNIIFAILLLLCLLVPHVSPNLFWPLTFIGLGFLFWLLINVAFLIYHLLGFRLKFLVSAIAIILNIGNIKAYFGSWENNETQATISIASLNTQLFGYFDPNKKKKPNWEIEVVETINKLQPDILCFQEFLSLGQYNLEYYKAKLGYQHAYFKILQDGRKKGQFGMALFSKFPILNNGSIEFSKYTGNMGAWIDIKVRGKNIRVMNVHLQSIRFSREDYKVIQNLKEKMKVEQSKTIIRRIKNAACIRADQVDLLKNRIKESIHPMILVGDFNEPPVSYSYGQIKGLLKDVYTSTHFGLETTYTGKFPAYRIDYIFHDKSFVSASYTSKIVPSDHKLIFAEIKL